MELWALNHRAWSKAMGEVDSSEALERAKEAELAGGEGLMRLLQGQPAEQS